MDSLFEQLMLHFEMSRNNHIFTLDMNSIVMKSFSTVTVTVLCKRNFKFWKLFSLISGSPVKRPAEYLWASPSDHFGLRGETFKLKCIFSGKYGMLLSII